MKKTKKTIRENYSGGRSVRYEGNNPTPKTAEDIKKVYEKAPKGSAYYAGK